MNKRYCIEVSQNGWEYTGHIFIECVGGIIKDDNNPRAIYAGNVYIEFDEEIGRIRMEDSE